MKKHHCITGTKAICFLTLTLIFAGVISACSSGDGTNEVSSESISSSTEKPQRDYLSRYPIIGDLPTMYVDLKNGYPVDEITKEEYVDASCTIVSDNADEDILSAELKLKGRGNYSWDLPKKPYTIKFSKKQDVLGMGKAKKWVLIANYSDKTFLRNYLTLNLAKEMGMPYTPECRYVNLVVNGEYRGLYLLTEKIETGSERVDIDVENGGVLMEIDPPYRHDFECDFCIDVKNNLHFTIHEPELKDYGSDFMNSVNAKAKKLLLNIDNSVKNGLSACAEYIDTDSFVDWYILNEFVKNHDSAFWTSCYCYIGADNKLYMGPVWDYDTCMGNQDIQTCMDPTGFYISRTAQASWYVLLARDKEFDSRVKARWTELKNNGTINRMIDSVDDAVALIHESELLDVERWPEALLRTDLRKSHSLYTFDEEIIYLKSFLKSRSGWLNSKWYIG